MTTTVGAIASALGATAPDEATGIEIDDVSHDSRQTGPGWLFVAIRGANVDGHRFVANSGASAAIVEEQVDAPMPQLVVADSRRAMAIAARLAHGAPDDHLSVIGVTGTNGKTTVTHLCEAVWQHLGLPSGVVGTLGASVKGTAQPLARTTPESSDLQRLLGSMRDAGVRSVAMEVSSHALDLARADGIHFTSAGFTNLSQDHLDFHGDMETYFRSKASLFTPERTDRAVINVDDTWGARLAADVAIPVTTVGLDAPADIQASDVELTASGSTMRVTTPVGTESISLPLIGGFNIRNALVACGLLLDDGLSLSDIVAGIATTSTVRGRMELVPHNGGFAVVVDYAHTPDAVTAALAAARDVASGQVIGLVGAGGDRDPDKRSLMGAALARGSDIAIVTTDNPRSESPGVIASEVRRGADANPRGTVLTVLDRRSAIAAAIERAEPGDVVMILGRGHESHQEVAGEFLPFDDAAVAAEILGADR